MRKLRQIIEWKRFTRKLIKLYDHLELPGLHSAIHMKRSRTKKRDANKQIWLDLIKTPLYRQGLKERYKIERDFSEAKQGHGLGHCR